MVRAILLQGARGGCCRGHVGCRQLRAGCRRVWRVWRGHVGCCRQCQPLRWTAAQRWHKSSSGRRWPRGGGGWTVACTSPSEGGEEPRLNSNRKGVTEDSAHGLEQRACGCSLLLVSEAGTSSTKGAGGSRQVKFAVVNFAEGHFAEPPGFCVVPPTRAHSVCEKFAEDPEFGVGTFAVNFETQNSPREIKAPRNPPPLCTGPDLMQCIVGSCGCSPGGDALGRGHGV